MERVTNSVTTAFALMVSVSIREITWPTLLAVNQLIGRRSRWAYNASRKSRTTNSCSCAPICPLSHTSTFLRVTASSTRMITLRSDPIWSDGSSRKPMVVPRMADTTLLPGMSWGCSNSAFKNGISSVNENTSNTAASRLSPTTPTSFGRCGRTKPHSRAHSPCGAFIAWVSAARRGGCTPRASRRRAGTIHDIDSGIHAAWWDIQRTCHPRPSGCCCRDRDAAGADRRDW